MLCDGKLKKEVYIETIRRWLLYSWLEGHGGVIEPSGQVVFLSCIASLRHSLQVTNIA